MRTATRQGHVQGQGRRVPDRLLAGCGACRHYARAIARALAEVDPDYASRYAGRAAAYDARLAALDAWIRDRIATVPAGAAGRCHLA